MTLDIISTGFQDRRVGFDKEEVNLYPMKLVSRTYKKEDTVLSIRGTNIGGGNFFCIAGPCSVESEEQFLTIANFVEQCGVQCLRGGIFKPRTSPYSFQGLGESGLELLAKIRNRVNLPIVSEVLSTELVEEMADIVDIIQIGARNMQNYPLLRKASRTGKPILLKRGMGATIEELLFSAEHIMSEGNHQVILCERGIRTFEHYTRYTLDLSAVPSLKSLTHLPVIVDPSHGTGRWELVKPMAKGATACGADGLMIEVHHQPECAQSDGTQSLNLHHFAELMKEVNKVAAAVF